ncbi:MAG: hypothetical protein HFH72_09105 [Lachnospiraceae bacterium]|nr:hypothetical protein [Lachnospiraceae bacterium]
MEYKIQKTYEATQTQEFSVDWNGFNFLIIYGHHINGWFIAIPNWKVCTEAGEPSQVDCNATKLAQTHIHDTAPVYLAQAIKEHWEYLKQREEREGN